MIDRFGLTPAIHAQLIGHIREVLPMLAKIHTALARLTEAKRALHVIALTRAHRGEKLALPLKLFQVHLLELWLGIEGIDMARTAGHVEKDAPLCLGLRKVRHLRHQRPLRLLRPQHRVKRQRAQPAVDSVNKFASIHGLININKLVTVE